MDQVPTPVGSTQLLLKGVTTVNAATGGGISIIASVLIAKFLPGSTIPLWVAVLVSLIGISFTLATLVALTQSVQQAKAIRTAFENQQPRTIVVSVVPPYYPYGACRCLLIVEWSRTAEIAVGSLVTVSTAEMTHELPLGTGTVRPKQQDGKAIVSLDQHYPGVEKYISAILDETTRGAAVQKLRIGPAFTLQGIYEQPATAQPSTPSDPNLNDISKATCSSSQLPSGEPR